MSFEKREFTHTGWFMFCPIYINPCGDCPEICEKYHLSWILDLCIALFNYLIVPMCMLKAKYTNQFIELNPVYGIRRLKKPVTVRKKI